MSAGRGSTEPSTGGGAHGTSPYASGGGGVTFERRVAVSYLTALLSRDTVPGLDGARVAQVAFQQAPGEAVDDLVISAQRGDDGSPTLTAAIGVRRRPKFTGSDLDTQKLLTDYVKSQADALEAGDDNEYVLVVAGPQKAAAEVAQLAGLARTSLQEAFYPLVEQPGRFTQNVRDRLIHLKTLIRGAMGELDMPSGHDDVRLATWRLLSRLTILQPRYEISDVTDWDAILRELRDSSLEKTIEGARALRDRLEVLAGGYAPQAATVDRATLRRDLHGLIATDRKRSDPGWIALARLEHTARATIRATIGQTPDRAGLHLAREDVANSLRHHLRNDTVLLIHGASGAGKSALTLAALEAEAADGPSQFEAVYLNLRQLPDSGLSLDAALGTPLAELLMLMTAPKRLLVIDGADYLAESTVTPFTSLVQTARDTDVRLAIVATNDSLGAVRAELGPTVKVTQFLVPGLEDGDLEEVIASNPDLHKLFSTPRSRELFRRPVIADLLVRAQASSDALTEVDAMSEIWAALVRRNEQKDHETPDSRDRTLRLLAEHALALVDDDELLEKIDLSAVDALRRDGILAPPSGTPWRRIPEFFHEQLRLYAVSQVLLSHADPATELLTASAPRWALPAARLAAQYLLAAGDSNENPLVGRLERLQSTFDRLAEAGFGERWSDVPAEALLPLPASGQILEPAWSSLVSANGAGLNRIFRLIRQRHFIGALVDRAVAEPVVAGLLKNRWPRDVQDKATHLIREWLQALVAANVDSDHPLRIRLRDEIANQVASADAEEEAFARAAAEALAARTSEQIAEEEARRSRFASRSGSIGFGRRRQEKPRQHQPTQLTDGTIVEQLGLLGPDLGKLGLGLLRRIAEYAPSRLQPAVENPFAARAIASFSPALLTELAAAYYIKDVHPEDDDFGWDEREEGVRNHGHSGSALPFSSPHRGPFLIMLQSDPRGGIAFVGRLLNHAALCRAKGFRSWQDSADPVDANSSILSITGTPHRYVGDSNVWLWYRGGGVGPYPCMSALQALEVVTDQLIGAEVPLSRIVELLMVDCANLAMPGFIVGMLVRHIEAAGRLIDPYLSEPEVWHLEFGRTVQEGSGMLARQDTATGADRRRWTFREAGMTLAIAADPARAAELDAVATALERRARDQLELGPGEELDAADAQMLATVAGWGSNLRRQSLRMTRTSEGTFIEGTVPDAVAAILEPGRQESDLMSEVFRLTNRYDFGRHSLAGPPPIDLAELHADVDVARRVLATEHSNFDLGFGLQACAAVACSVIERRFLTESDPELDDLTWAAEQLLEVAAVYGKLPASEAFEFSYFAHDPDVPASRAVALLLLPDAIDLVPALDPADGAPYEKIISANRWAATHAPLDDRMTWSRSLDRIWKAEPIDLPGEGSSHTFILDLVEFSIRSCVIGDWDDEHQRRRPAALTGPLINALATADVNRIAAERLLPALRALQGAPRAEELGERVRTLFDGVLSAYLRVRQQEEHGPQHSATDMLTVARALLVLHDEQPDAIFRQLEIVIDRNDLLDEFMDAVAAVAEENPNLASTAASVWPSLMEHAMNLMDIGHSPVGSGLLPGRGVASLIPNPTYGNNYLVRELQSTPISWIDFHAIVPLVPRWLAYAVGYRECVDQLVALLRLTDIEEQVELGLPWIDELVGAAPGSVARHSYLLPGWLEAVRSATLTTERKSKWQRIIDLLLVAGDDRVADLAD